MAVSNRPIRAVAVCALLTALVAFGAVAQEAEEAPEAEDAQVGVSLTVSHASDEPGPTDPSAAELDRQLRPQFRYQSIRVIHEHHLVLHMQEVGGVDLPTGRRVELRPLSVTPSGVLLAVEIAGKLQTDLRVPNRQQVVIGVDRYQQGKLILTLRPEY